MITTKTMKSISMTAVAIATTLSMIKMTVKMTAKSTTIIKTPENRWFLF